jgi:hypothetical protein
MVARGKLIHDAIPARLKLRKFDIFGWLKLKLLQYNISSCLYMLDTWERLLFNFFFLVMLMLSIFLFVTYLSTASTTFLSGNPKFEIPSYILAHFLYSCWSNCYFLSRSAYSTLLSATSVLMHGNDNVGIFLECQVKNTNILLSAIVMEIIHSSATSTAAFKLSISDVFNESLIISSTKHD